MLTAVLTVLGIGVGLYGGVWIQRMRESHERRMKLFDLKVDELKRLQSVSEALFLVRRGFASKSDAPEALANALSRSLVRSILCYLSSFQKHTLKI